MKASLPAFVFAVVVLELPGIATAQDPSSQSAARSEAGIEHLQKVLSVTLPDDKDLLEEMSLAKLLAALERRLLRDKKIALQVDEKGLGKDFSKIAAARVKLPAAKNLTLRTVLRLALSQASGPDSELEYAFRPEGFVITRPALAAHEQVYVVRDLLEHVPRLLPELKKDDAISFTDLSPTDSPALLVRWLASCTAPRTWETMQIHNASRLIVRAPPLRQEEVAELIEVLRRLADTAVVMNARLYEVERAFYVKHVAPLFAKDPDHPPAVVRIEAPLFKRLARRPPLLESEDVKLRLNQPAVFLSHFSVFRFAAGPKPLREDRPEFRKGMADMAAGTGLAGVSFTVRPLVSADRRSMRLRITQVISQLVSIDKSKKLDVTTGQEVEVESPNVRKTSVTGTVQIPDGSPILMPAEYRPPGKGNEDKVWLLVARPFIWIADEVEEIRKGGGEVSPQSIWNSEIPQDERPLPKKPLPFNDDVKEILQALLTDVLTNPALKHTREFYGTARDRTFTLVDTGMFDWPAEFKPETHGFRHVQPDRFVNQRRILGIRLDKFDLKQERSSQFNTPVEVCLFNAGGSANGGVIGGCSVYYTPKRVGKRWTVELEGLLDP